MESLESAPGVVDDALRRQVLARLRERYGAAVEWASRGEPDAHPFENLEWILGPRRNAARDGAVFETCVSELVVLWLQDLLAELEGVDAGRGQPAAEEKADATADLRRVAAQRLRVATREFAAAFLSPA